MAFDLNLNYNFNDIIYSLQGMGVYDVFLPFLLVFAIFFAVLEKTKVLGTSKRNINALVSMVVGFLLVAQRPIVDLINMFLPKVALIIVILLMFLLLLSLITEDNKIIHFEGLSLGIGVVVIIVALFIALSPTFDIDQNTRDSILRIVIPLGVLFAVYKLIAGDDKPKVTRKSPDGTEHFEDFFTRLGESIKRK